MALIKHHMNIVCSIMEVGKRVTAFCGEMRIWEVAFIINEPTLRPAKITNTPNAYFLSARFWPQQIIYSENDNQQTFVFHRTCLFHCYHVSNRCFHLYFHPTPPKRQHNHLTITQKKRKDERCGVVLCYVVLWW